MLCKKIHSFSYASLLAAACMSASCAFAAEAARVEFASGAAVAASAGGVLRNLSKGSVLEPGETVRTAANARAQLRFTDGGMVSLQPDTEFRIDEYAFNASEPGKEKGFFSLVRGGLRTITGLIGRSTRSNYQVNTTVATIGIRGTEYSALFTGGTDGTLSLATGEGIVEICNAGGCVTVAGGESAIVTGANSQPRRVDEPPVLPPSRFDAVQSGNVFSTAENRTSSGSIPTFGPALKSGGGFNVAIAGQKNGADHLESLSGVTANFGSSSELMDGTTATPTTIKTKKVDSSFARDGEVGWGYWASGNRNGSDALSHVHYVVGTPMTVTGSTNMASATYKLAGYTMPTTASGVAGSSVSGSMVISIGGGYVSGNLSLSVGINGATVGYSGIAITTSPGPQFSGGSASTIDFRGFMAGSTGQYAPVVYQMNGGTLGMLSGAAVFQRQ